MVLFRDLPFDRTIIFQCDVSHAHFTGNPRSQSHAAIEFCWQANRPAGLQDVARQLMSRIERCQRHRIQRLQLALFAATKGQPSGIAGQDGPLLKLTIVAGGWHSFRIQHQTANTRQQDVRISQQFET